MPENSTDLNISTEENITLSKTDVVDLLTTLLQSDNAFAKDFADRVIPFLSHQIRNSLSVEPGTLSLNKATDSIAEKLSKVVGKQVDAIAGSFDRFLKQADQVQANYITLLNKANVNLGRAIQERLRVPDMTFKSFKDPLDQMASAMPRYSSVGFPDLMGITRKESMQIKTRWFNMMGNLLSRVAQSTGRYQPSPLTNLFNFGHGVKNFATGAADLFRPGDAGEGMASRVWRSIESEGVEITIGGFSQEAKNELCKLLKKCSKRGRGESTDYENLLDVDLPELSKARAPGFLRALSGVAAQVVSLVYSLPKDMITAAILAGVMGHPVIAGLLGAGSIPAAYATYRLGVAGPINLLGRLFGRQRDFLPTGSWLPWRWGHRAPRPPPVPSWNYAGGQTIPMPGAATTMTGARGISQPYLPGLESFASEPTPIPTPAAAERLWPKIFSILSGRGATGEGLSWKEAWRLGYWAEYAEKRFGVRLQGIPGTTRVSRGRGIWQALTSGKSLPAEITFTERELALQLTQMQRAEGVWVTAERAKTALEISKARRFANWLERLMFREQNVARMGQVGRIMDVRTVQGLVQRGVPGISEQMLLPGILGETSSTMRPLTLWERVKTFLGFGPSAGVQPGQLTGQIMPTRGSLSAATATQDVQLYLKLGKQGSAQGPALLQRWAKWFGRTTFQKVTPGAKGWIGGTGAAGRNIGSTSFRGVGGMMQVLGPILAFAAAAQSAAEGHQVDAAYSTIAGLAMLGGPIGALVALGIGFGIQLPEALLLDPNDPMKKESIPNRFRAIKAYHTRYIKQLTSRMKGMSGVEADKEANRWFAKEMQTLENEYSERAGIATPESDSSTRKMLKAKIDVLQKNYSDAGYAEVARDVHIAYNRQLIRNETRINLMNRLNTLRSVRTGAPKVLEEMPEYKSGAARFAEWMKPAWNPEPGVYRNFTGMPWMPPQTIDLRTPEEKKKAMEPEAAFSLNTILTDALAGLVGGIKDAYGVGPKNDITQIDVEKDLGTIVNMFKGGKLDATNNALIELMQRQLGAVGSLRASMEKGKSPSEQVTAPASGDSLPGITGDAGDTRDPAYVLRGRVWDKVRGAYVLP